MERFCRGGQIRTDDLLVPNQARYRTTLRPENFMTETGFVPDIRSLLCFGVRYSQSSIIRH